MNTWLTSQLCLTDVMSTIPVTIYGVSALSFMMAMYALEERHRRYVLAFSVGCLLSSVYGFLSGAWPFGVVEIIWFGIAIHRYGKTPATSSRTGTGPSTGL